MPPNYNPHSPCVLGIEWMPSSDQFAYLDSDRSVIACALVADTNDTIQNVWAMVGAWYGQQSVSLEVYDITAGPPPLPALTWTTYYPGCDRYNAPSPWRGGSWGPHEGWDPASAGSAAMWQSVDSVALTPGFSWPISGQPVDNDQFAFTYYGLGFDFALGFLATSGSMTGRWVTRVRSHAKIAQYYAFDKPGGVTVTPYLWLEGSKFLGSPFTVYAEQGPVDVTYDWYVNPKTGLPWTEGDISGFDCGLLGANNGTGFVAAPTGSANNMATILQADLQVESAASDPRVSMAAQTQGPVGVDGNGQGWTVWELRDVASGVPANLTLVAGNKYLFAFRKNALASTTVTALACIAESPDRTDPRNISGVVGPAPLETSLAVYGPPYWTQYTGPLAFGQPNKPGLQGRGVLLDPASRRIVELGIEGGITAGIVLQEPAFAISKDSQPYATTSPLDGTDEWPALAEWFNNSPINVNRSMQQEITAAATDDYGWVWILCAMVAGTSDGDLLVKVKRRSDDVQMGGTATVTSASLSPPVHAWQKVGVRLPADASLVNGTQYYLEVTSTASETQGWLVQAVNSGYEPNPTGPPAGTNAAAGAGGAIDTLTFDDPMMERFGFTPPAAPGSVVACVNLSVVPVAPSGFVAVAAGQTCCLDYIQLSWDMVGAVLCGSFLAHEIQRDDGDGVWRTIARVTDPAVVAFDDHESLANTPANYRMRLVRDDGVPSDWTATATATAAMVGCVGLVFTSNEAPALEVFYPDVVASRTFEFPSFENTFAPLGRDYQVVFRELEDRGVTFNSKLRVRAGNMPCGSGCDDATGFGPAVFDPLKAIARAGLSYVCVKNEAGNRWYAFVKTPAGEWTQHGIEKFGGFAAYTMDVQVTEVTNVPSVPDAGVAGS